MKFLLKLILIWFFSLQISYASQNNQIPPDEAKQLVKDAVIYALENKNSHMDYSKYVSKEFIIHIDGEVFNYAHWIIHLKHIKDLIKSMKPTFDWMIAENDNIAAIYHVNLIKNDNSKLEVRVFAFFKIKNNKIVYVEELTRLIKGEEKDKNIGSTK